MQLEDEINDDCENESDCDYDDDDDDGDVDDNTEDWRWSYRWEMASQDYNSLSLWEFLFVRHYTSVFMGIFVC